MDDPWGSPWANDDSESMEAGFTSLSIISNQQDEGQDSASPLREAAEADWTRFQGSTSDHSVSPAIEVKGLRIPDHIIQTDLATPGWETATSPGWAEEVAEITNTVGVPDSRQADSMRLGSGRALQGEGQNISNSETSNSTSEAAMGQNGEDNVDDGQDCGDKGLDPSLPMSERASSEKTVISFPAASSTKVANIMSSPRPSVSSYPSDTSVIENVVDSPRTSFEDETRRPTFQRAGSVQVQKLVEHFDSLAEAKNEKIYSPVKGQVAPLTNADRPDGDGTYECQARGMGCYSAATTRELSAEDFVLQNTSKDNTFVEKEDVFRVPSELVDRLYIDSMIQPVADPTPDRELYKEGQTSFTVEQGKCWYRISRLETLRQSKSGDVDNYVRVDWSRSKVRRDTIEIVTRWKAEDRYGGGIGCGLGDGSSFGWGDTRSLSARPFKDAFPKQPGPRLSIFRMPSLPSNPATPTCFSIPSPLAPPEAGGMSSDVPPVFNWTSIPVTAADQFGQHSMMESQANPSLHTSIVSPMTVRSSRHLAAQDDCLTPNPKFLNEQTLATIPSNSDEHSLGPFPQIQQSIDSQLLPAPFFIPTTPPPNGNHDFDTNEDDWGDMVSATPPDSEVPDVVGKHHTPFQINDSIFGSSQAPAYLPIDVAASAKRLFSLDSFATTPPSIAEIVPDTPLAAHSPPSSSQAPTEASTYTYSHENSHSSLPTPPLRPKLSKSQPRTVQNLTTTNIDTRDQHNPPPETQWASTAVNILGVLEALDDGDVGYRDDDGGWAFNGDGDEVMSHDKLDAIMPTQQRSDFASASSVIGSGNLADDVNEHEPGTRSDDVDEINAILNALPDLKYMFR